MEPLLRWRKQVKEPNVLLARNFTDCFRVRFQNRVSIFGFGQKVLWMVLGRDGSCQNQSRCFAIVTRVRSRQRVIDKRAKFVLEVLNAFQAIE